MAVKKAEKTGRILPSASTDGALMAKALSNTSLASRTTRLHSQPTARPTNAGPALLLPCAKALAWSKTADANGWLGLTNGGADV
jgi:hypothetical protein